MSLISVLERVYGIRVRKYTQTRSVYRLHTDVGKLCLKPLEVRREDAVFITQVLQFTEATGFPYSPKVLPTRHGERFVENAGQKIIVTNWIDGSSPSYKHSSELIKSVQTLAHFHRHSEGLQTSTIPPNRNRIWSREANALEGRRAIKEHYNGHQAAVFQELCAESSRRFATSTVRQALQKEADKRAFIHGDFNYPNLVVDKEGHHQLIDFDNTALDIRMEDLAHIIHRNYPWQIDGVIRLVEAYSRERPIPADELRLLAALLYEPYPLLRAIRQRRQNTSSFQRIVPERRVLDQFARGLQRLM